MTGQVPADELAGEHAARHDIVQACRAMNGLGLNQGMSGNISVRLRHRLLITPTSTPYDAMVPDDIAALDIDDSAGTWTGPRRPSSEWRMHRDILAGRPEFGALVHAHPIYCTALAMMRRGIPPCHYMVATFGGEDVRCADYALFGTAELSACVVAALQDRSACLMANHGMIACGRTLAEAMWRAVELEALARQYHACLAAGGPVLLSSAQISAAQEQFASYRP
jgi:L-fuculose-phosphate aldolase